MAAPAAALLAGAVTAAGKERDGLGLGSGGGRALQAGKAQALSHRAGRHRAED